MKLAVVAILGAFLRAILLLVVLPFRGPDYRMNCALGEDKAWNAFLAGNPNEYISSRAYRTGWGRRQKLINWIFSDTNHCKQSYEDELKRVNAPAEYRIDWKRAACVCTNCLEERRGG